MKGISLLIVTIIAVLLSSCKTEDKKQSITTTQETNIDTANGSCPYLTKDNKGNIVLSWIKQVDTATSVFCFAVSPDEGKTFNKAIEIQASTNVHPHGENMPKVIFKPSGVKVTTRYGSPSFGGS